MIRDATENDAADIAAIYNHYIEDTIISFEETPLGVAEMAGRIAQAQKAGFSWLVAVDGANLVGYACSSRWNTRAAYRHSVEVSVYLRDDARGCGWGTRLYEALFARLRESGVHTAIAGIALPNEGSVALHEKFGMQKAAHYKAVGRKFGQWIDVGYWQLIIGEG